MDDKLEYEGERADGSFSGSIRIADDVIKNIAILAAADVRGVSGIAGVPCDEAKSAAPGKYPFKGVKAEVSEDEARITLPITAEYGQNLPRVSGKVQEKVAETVENMTGITVTEVNVSITGIEIP